MVTVGVLKHHPTGPISIRCCESSGVGEEVSEMGASLLDGLKMIPSCRVRTVPELVNEYSGAWCFQLDR
jgi:hypothetical protein